MVARYPIDKRGRPVGERRESGSQARYGKKAAPRADLEPANIPNRQIGG